LQFPPFQMVVVVMNGDAYLAHEKLK
jgi:hypothetical protein